MVPDGITSAIVFALLIAPGLTFTLLANRRRPVIERSTFEEISRTVLASAGFTAVAALAWSWAWVLLTAGLPAEPDLYALLPVYALTAATALTACFLAYVADRILARRGPGADLRPASAWYLTFRQFRAPGHQTLVNVTMKDGTAWVGRLITYTPDNSGNDRDLVLGGTVAQRLANGTWTQLDEAWSRVILSAGNVASIQVAFPPEDA